MDILPLEIKAKNHDFLENMQLVSQFRSVDLIFAMPVYLPVYDTRTAQCTRAPGSLL